jgi:hypothetical protein
MELEILEDNEIIARRTKNPVTRLNFLFTFNCGDSIELINNFNSVSSRSLLDFICSESRLIKAIPKTAKAIHPLTNLMMARTIGHSKRTRRNAPTYWIASTAILNLQLVEINRIIEVIEIIMMANKTKISNSRV